MTSSNPATGTQPTDHTRHALPPDAVLLAPALPDAVPIRPPAGAWGLVVVAVRTTPAAGSPVRLVGDAPAPAPDHTDTAALLAGVWLPAPPPAALHDGDVVVRLHPPDDGDPAVADVEVVAATQGDWTTVRRWQAVGARWPHEIALSVLVHMRYLADAARSGRRSRVLSPPPCPQDSSRPDSPASPRARRAAPRRTPSPP